MFLSVTYSNEKEFVVLRSGTRITGRGECHYRHLGVKILARRGVSSINLLLRMIILDELDRGNISLHVFLHVTVS